MTTIPELLAPVKADVAWVPGRGESAFVGLALPVNASTELWNLREIARTDVPRLVAAIEAVTGLHYEGVAYADDIPEGGNDDVPEDYERHYCNEDGHDWPCPTITAVVAALGGGA